MKGAAGLAAGDAAVAGSTASWTVASGSRASVMADAVVLRVCVHGRCENRAKRGEQPFRDFRDS